jgi:hypothetical protein
MNGQELKQYKNSKYWISEDGKMFSKNGDKLRPIKACLNSNGRYRFYLYIDGAKHKVYRYRAIWLAWKGETGDLTIDHIDGNKTNDILSNLQLLTLEENVRKGNNNEEE